jgi:uncharacterized protein
MKRRQNFFFKLIPPRTTFITDMTAAERAIMEDHAQYMRSAQAAGEVLIAGPVLAPAGVFGMAVLAMADLAAAHTFCQRDPSVRAGLNTFELYPMNILATHPEAD